MNRGTSTPGLLGRECEAMGSMRHMYTVVAANTRTDGWTVQDTAVTWASHLSTTRHDLAATRESQPE